MAGLLISLFSLSLSQNVGGRLGLVLVGIAVSLAGIVGVINRAYVAKAPWRSR